MITATFTATRETKNKIVYDEKVEDGAWPAVGTLYVAKPVAVQLGSPTTLTVTIEAQS